MKNFFKKYKRPIYCVLTVILAYIIMLFCAGHRIDFSKNTPDPVVSMPEESLPTFDLSENDDSDESYVFDASDFVIFPETSEMSEDSVSTDESDDISREISEADISKPPLTPEESKSEESKSEESKPVIEDSSVPDEISEQPTETSEIPPEISDVSEEESEMPPEVSDVSEESEMPPEVSEPTGEESDVPPEVSEQPPEVSDDPPETTFEIYTPYVSVPLVLNPAWNGATSTGFAYGDGTVANPYVIESPEQLAYFRDTVNSGESFAGQYISLNAHIKINEGDLSTELPVGANSWSSIGTPSNPFSGTFYGNGNFVLGLYGGGLFGYSDGCIYSVSVAYSYITADGGVVGNAVKNYDSNTPAIVSGCNITDSIVSGLGGVIGFADGCTVSACNNFASVIGNTAWCGGVIGQTSMSQVSGCYNMGYVSVTDKCGGITGAAFWSDFSSCYNIGTVTSSSFAGAIAGENNGSTYADCGYLNTSADYIYYDVLNGESTEADGIKSFTSQQIK